MTIKDLREAIDGLPGEMLVFICSSRAGGHGEGWPLCHSSIEHIKVVRNQLGAYGLPEGEQLVLEILDSGIISGEDI